MNRALRRLASASLLCLALTAAAPEGAEAPRLPGLPAGWTASHMVPVGYVRLEGFRPFKLGIRKAGNKWHLFVGEGGGSTTVNTGFRAIDITDPLRPVALPHVPVEEGDGQITLHGDLLIAGRQQAFAPEEVGGSIEYPYRGLAAKPSALASLYDISDPIRPRKLSDWIAPGWATHRNGYPGGRYAYMSAWIAGYRGQSILVVLDVSDPRHPREAGRWAMPGQAQDEAEIAPPSGFHGPPSLSADGKMLTLGYTPSFINLDISDPAHPKLIGRLDFSPLAPLGTQSIHSVVSLGKGLFHLNTEPSRQGCGQESPAFAAIVDNTDPTKPRLLSYYPRPVPAPDSGLVSFCDKEGRFGPHNVVTELHQEGVAQTAPLVFMTYFNAGLRVFDVSRPAMPREVGWFLPKIGPWKDKKRGPEDVIADTRGYVYVSDGNDGGIWVLRYVP